MAAAVQIDPEGLEKARRLIWQAYGYGTHELAVDYFHASKARTKIVSSPARTAKSFSGWKDILPDVILHGAKLLLDPLTETQRGWIVAPNYGLAKEFDYAWEDLVERRQSVGFEYKLGQKKNNPKQGDMQIVLEWGKNARGQDVQSIIEVRSATNLQSLQSEQLDWAILSEAARLPESVWYKYLRTRVGRSVWPTTPDIQAAWIHKLIQDGIANPSLGIEHFAFTGKANPKYDWGNYWIEHQKAELNIVNEVLTHPVDSTQPPSAVNGHDCFDDMTQCEAMKEDGFAEQMGGKWVFHRGRAVPIRESVGPAGQPSHVIHADLSWFRYADLHVSFDYGYTDGTAILFWLVGPRQVVLRKSIYETGLVPDDIVSRVQSMVSWFQQTYDSSNMLKRLVGDPKKPEVAELFRRRGLPIWDVDKSAQVDRKAGHMQLMNYLHTDPATGEPGMLIHVENQEVIREWRTLRRNSSVRNEDSSTAFVGADHAYDACFHPDTEMLTSNGWRLVSDVSVGEIVATRSHEGDMEWRPVERTTELDFDGELLECNSRRGASFSVTPDHRLVVCSQFEAKKSKNGRTHFVRAGDFADGENTRNGPLAEGKTASSYWIPCFSHVGNGEETYGADFYYFVGFYLAEGCRSDTRGRKYVHIDQKNRQVLIDIARSLGFDNEPYQTRDGLYRLSLRSDFLFDVLGEKQLSWQKRIPRFLLERGNQEELRALLNGMMDGDGTWSQWKYDTTSEGLADDFQELCARLGWTARKSKTERWRIQRTPGNRLSPGRPQWRVGIRKSDTTHRYYCLTRNQIERRRYIGPVYCVTVPPHHTVLTRRNGRLTWIGQSRYFVMTRPIPDAVSKPREASPFERRRQLILAEKRRRERATVASAYGLRRVGGLL